MPVINFGGVEQALTRTLDGLGRYPDMEITVFVKQRVRDPYYIDWFAAHPEIRLHVVYPLSARFQGMCTFTRRMVVMESLRRIVFSVYKKYRRVILKMNRDWKNADIYIDYCDFSFNRELATRRRPCVAWSHFSIERFTCTRQFRYLDRYDRLICITDYFQNELSRTWPQYADRTARIYIPIDFEQIAHMATDGPRMSGQYFCAVSRLAPDKDVATIIRAFNEFWCENNCPDVKLVLIGDGASRGELEQMAAAMPCGKNIVFTGTVPHPYGYMRGAMAHILSSYNEGLGMVVIEAAATHTPNIASNCPDGPREILQDGAAGILFAPGDVAALSRAMSDVYNNRADVSAMVRAGADALRRFDTAVVSDQIHSMILELTDKK